MNLGNQNNSLKKLLDDIENPDESLKESRKAAEDAERDGLELQTLSREVPERFSHMARLEKAAFSAKQKLEHVNQELEEYYESDWYVNNHDDTGPRPRDWDVLARKTELLMEMVDHLTVLSHIASVTAQQEFDVIDYQRQVGDAQQLQNQIDRNVQHFKDFTDKVENHVQKIVDQTAKIERLNEELNSKKDKIRQLEQELAAKDED